MYDTEIDFDYDEFNRVIRKEIDDEYVITYEYTNGLLTKETVSELNSDFIKYNLYEYNDNNKSIISSAYYIDDTLIEKNTIKYDNDYNIISNEYENILPNDKYIINSNDEISKEIYDIANDYIEDDNDEKIVAIYDAYNQKDDKHHYYVALENRGYMYIDNEKGEYKVQVYSKDNVFPTTSFYYSIHN